MTPKTFKIKSFGCQMNVYDGERMAELLGAQGMSAADDGEDADLVVLNTCHIREKAAEKAYSDVGRLKREDGSKPLIALAGCVAQAEGAEAKRRSALIDIVVGPQAYHRLPEMVAEASHGGRPVDTDMPAISKFDALPLRRRANPSTFLTVRLRKFCTYCVVPYAAEPRSRAPGTISLARRRRSSMAARGDRPARAERECRRDGSEVGLAEPSCTPAVDGLERIRYDEPPTDVTDELIAAHGEVGC
jgi:tRNA-2-methylthio-N6-dimethylallyladenosine synthase